MIISDLRAGMESFTEMTNRVTTLVRATGIEDSGRMSGGAGTERPDPEVPERARRRTFTAKYKLEMLSAYDAAPDGEKGALLRREGLYSSHIVAWRRAREAGALAGLAVPRGRRRRDRRAQRLRCRRCRAGQLLPTPPPQPVTAAAGAAAAQGPAAAPRVVRVRAVRDPR